jgi:benzoyl-CoA reductase/2-hydroxyglutaryl-CoA dehydratase subunit BcrC/BadD/HgdB
MTPAHHFHDATASAAPARISLDAWDRRYEQLRARGLSEPFYGGPLRRHLTEGRDLRLCSLQFDNSPAALRLWNFLLTEEDRLRQARREGKKLVGTMKDLGTVPVLAYAFPNLTAFYPDGAWWIPCVMELSDGLFRIADQLGIDESFCPVRAMLGAFVTEAHFPRPDLLVCSAGATCDDFSAIAQRLEGLGHPIFWWEMPHRRHPDPGEAAIELPGGFGAPASQVGFVRQELGRIRQALEVLAGGVISDEALLDGIREANKVRGLLKELRTLVFTANPCPLPALEHLIAEMLSIHFCSDRSETIAVLGELLDEVRSRVNAGKGPVRKDAARIFWVNPVADLRAMNLLEDCGGRICGAEYLFCHAWDEIPENLDPMEALARMALADPMAGTVADRARRIVSDAREYRAEAVVVSRIPGASHCAFEAGIISEIVHSSLDIPVLECEVPPVSDALTPALRARLEALVETVLARRT